MIVLRKLFTRNIIEQKKHTYVVDNERIVYKSNKFETKYHLDHSKGKNKCIS